MKRIFRSVAIISSIIMAASSVSFAQRNTASTNISDTAFIRKNIMDNIAEIQLSDMARAKGDESIRKVARQMVGDHYEMLEDMRKVGRKKDMKNINMNADGTTAGNDVVPTGTPDTTTIAVNGTATAGTGTGTTGAASGNAGVSSRANSGTTATAASGGAANGGAGTDNSGSRVGTSSTPGGAVTTGTANSHSGMAGMGGMNDLHSATGAAFTKMWATQMITMHAAKLAELESASQRVKDPELLEAINKAIPKVRGHLDMLRAAGNK